MSVAGPVSSFTDFEALGKGHRGYAHKLTPLFNQCDFVTKESDRHTISFKEGSKRLREQMKDSFELIENQTGRMVKEFKIGKTHVCSQYYNPAQPLDWDTHGGLPVSWENYEKKGFDGMIVLGCVIKDIIPKVILETNKALKMNQHSYAAGLAQSLIQYYLLQNPDDRLRSVTVEDLGNKTGKDELGSPASVIYVAYKLEPGTTNSELKMKVEPYERPTENIQFTGDAPTEQLQKQQKEVHRELNVSFGELAIADEDTFKSDTASSNPLQSSTPVKILQNQDVMPPKRKKLTKEEKILFLRCYLALEVIDWDEIAETVYNKRHESLSREIVHHYEQNLDLKTTLKGRIENYIKRVKNDKGATEKEPDVKALIQRI